MCLQPWSQRLVCFAAPAKARLFHPEALGGGTHTLSRLEDFEWRELEYSAGWAQVDFAPVIDEAPGARHGTRGCGDAWAMSSSVPDGKPDEGEVGGAARTPPPRAPGWGWHWVGLGGRLR